MQEEIKNQNLAGALEWVRKGYTVIDLIPQDKRPYRKWVYGVTTEDGVAKLWHEHPKALIGVLSGPSDLVVFDFDKKSDGLVSYNQMCQVYPEMLSTYTESTRSDGRHVFFKRNELHIKKGVNVFINKDGSSKVSGRVWPGVDICAMGSLCVVAPSIDETGEYKALNDKPIQPISEGLVDLLRKAGRVMDAGDFEEYEPDPVYSTKEAQPIPNRHYKGEYAPLCIKGIVARLRDGKAGHDDMFALLCYMSGLNLEKEAMLSIFSVSPKFDTDITEYHIDYALRRGYKCQTCATMQANGLCTGGAGCNSGKSPAWNYRNNYYVNNWPYNQAKEDVGIAEMLVDLYGDEIRYVVPNNTWLVFKDGYWPVDQRERHLWQLIEGMAGLIYDRILFLSSQTRYYSEGDERKKYAAFVNNQYGQYRYMRTVKGINTIIAAAAHIDDRIAVSSLDKLDSDKHLINLKNGVYDLNAGEFISHGEATRAFLMTRQAAVVYNKAANCPRFLQFLDEITCGDKDLARDIQKWLGYCLSGYTNEQEFRVLKGVGDNGKSLLMKVIQDIMGSYADRAQSTSYTYSPGGSNGRFDFGDKNGLRLLVCSETSANERWNVQKVQSHTGDEPISGEQKYKDGVSYRPMFKLMFLFNHIPTVKKDVAMGKRLHIMPFDLELEEDQKDIFLADKLLSEAEGILNWMIEGFNMWRADGFRNKCKAMVDTTNEYWQAVDYMTIFISEQCDTGKDENGEKYWCFPEDLFKAYESWQSTYPEAEKLSQKVFAGKINSLGYPLEARRSKDKKDENGKPIVYKVRVGVRPKPPKLEDYSSFIAPMKKVNVVCL